MWKRVVVLVITFTVLLGTSIGWAEDNQAEILLSAENIYQEMKDIQTYFSSGITYKEFRNIYKKTLINTDNFINKCSKIKSHDKSITDLCYFMGDVTANYQHIDVVWNLKIYSRDGETLWKNDPLWKEYPKLSNLRPVYNNEYKTDSVLQIVIDDMTTRLAKVKTTIDKIKESI
jgi:hypothetical protein